MDYKAYIEDDISKRLSMLITSIHIIKTDMERGDTGNVKERLFHLLCDVYFLNGRLEMLEYVNNMEKSKGV